MGSVIANLVKLGGVSSAPLATGPPGEVRGRQRFLGDQVGGLVDWFVGCVIRMYGYCMMMRWEVLQLSKSEMQQSDLVATIGHSFELEYTGIMMAMMERTWNQTC